MRSLTVARKWFLETVQEEKGLNGLNLHEIPPEHVSALGHALLLTADVWKDESRQELWRRGWKDVWRTARTMVGAAADDQRSSNKCLRPEDLQCCFRVLDHAAKKWASKVELSKVEG